MIKRKKISKPVVAKPTKEELMFVQVKSIIRSGMIEKEGIKYEVYKDHLGNLTVGIGHLVKPRDKLKLGDVISAQRVEILFNQDISDAIWAAIDQAKQAGEFEVDFVTALVHVNFQLGIHWTKEWPNTWKNLKAGRLQKVINAVMGSLWHRQTPVRTNAFKQALLIEMIEDNRTLPLTDNA